MKKYIFLLIAIVALTIISCSDNCSDIDAPASPSLFLDVYDEDSTTGDNIFIDSLYLDTQVLVQDYEQNDVPFNVVFDSRLMHIVLENKVLVDDTLYVKFNNPDTMDKDSIKLFYSTEKIEEECYTQFKVNSVTFPDNENELVNGIFKVKI